MHHYMRNSLFSIGLLVAFSACKKEEAAPAETLLRVNSYKQTCQAEGVFSCYLTQEGDQVGSNNWQLFYNNIEGFTYQEGFIYTLKVKIEKVANPPADGSSLKYTLLEVVSKEKG